jgi:serine/threonine protein kinase
MSSANGVLTEGARPAAGYEVIAHLSRGLALDVYDAWSEERNCPCVLKLVRPDRREPRVRRRLVKEGELLMGLSHPHFVRAYELVRRPRTLLVLETLDGQTLDHLIQASPRRLSSGDVAELGLQLCSAIRYLHGRGHLHLDLKPSNVIAQSGQAKLIDLSLSRPPGPSRRGAGSPPYLAPEQARGGEVTEATDVWGLGATLYEAATGMPPFPDARPHRYPQASRRAPSLRQSRRAPHPLTGAIDACLEPDPWRRPSVAELSSQLDSVLAALADS